MTTRKKSNAIKEIEKIRKSSLKFNVQKYETRYTVDNNIIATTKIQNNYGLINPIIHFSNILSRS